VLLGNDAVPDVQEASFNALEELIGDCILLSNVNYALEVLPCPSTSSGSVLWTTPSAKWTLFAETGLTCNKLLTHGMEWKDMTQQQQKIDRERRTLAEKLLSDLSGIPYSSAATFIGTKKTTQDSQEAGAADESAVSGRGKSSIEGRDRTKSNLVCRHIFLDYL
jgi:hypothetical protein